MKKFKLKTKNTFLIDKTLPRLLYTYSFIIGTYYCNYNLLLFVVLETDFCVLESYRFCSFIKTLFLARETLFRLIGKNVLILSHAVS